MCIARAQAEIGSVPWDQHARIVSDKGSYEYDYLGEGLIMAKVREILSPMGVAVFVATESATPVQGGYFVVISITFVKGDDTFTIKGGGLGQDNRDKAYNKALTSAVRTCLTKQFLQGGDIDPEQTVNERPAPGPAKLADARIKQVIQAAIDNGVVMPDGSVDQALLLRLASYTAGSQVKRMDEIPGASVDKLCDVMLPGWAVSDPAARMDKLVSFEEEHGWLPTSR